ncbi:MAG: 50S ribosomal protein L10 [Candidatus Curtissbacteria bacterium]|nr:50S ribosomal protein L10 [Candidatus Curtissbacteria bacterium]
MKKTTLSSREKKVESVQSLAEKVKKSKTIAFTDYRGLTVNQIKELREKIKEAGGELIVAKNSLFKRALLKNDLEIGEDQLIGPTAAVFSYEDEIAPIKNIADNAKTFGLPKFKFGFFAKDQLDENGLETLAKIPGRDVLHGQVVGAISSPLYGIVSVLSANIRNLVYVLDQASKKV